jgi:O-antigen/teichoic acid export membrane protein
MTPQIAEVSYVPLIFLSAPLAITLSQSISGRIFYGVGQLRWFAWAAICEAIANLVMSVILVRFYGINGVAIGTMIPNFVFSLAIATAACRYLGVSTATYFASTFGRPLIAALCPLTLWASLYSLTGVPNSWSSLVSFGISGLLVYGIAGWFLEPTARTLTSHLLKTLRGESSTKLPDNGNLAQQHDVASSFNE